MPDKKREELQEFLDQLPPEEAAALARKLELQRALGQETPAESILAGLRRQLRVAQPARTPTLFRLAAAGFEEFLVDHPGASRMPGLIPRASIDPWWQTLKQLVPEEMKAAEAELARHVAANDWTAIERFAGVVQSAARGWTETTLAGADAPADPGLAADFAEIAHLLAIAEPLRQAVELASTVAARLGQTRARRILEFGDETVAEARQQYLRFSQAHGADAHYVALGLLNRLERPWQILRLARALGWNPEDAATPHPELAILADRLIHDLALLAEDVDALMPRPDDAVADAIDFRKLQQALTRCIECAEQMAGSPGLGPDTARGKQVLATRMRLARAIVPDRLHGVAEAALAVLPRERGGERPDLDIMPSGDTIEQAMRAARFLVLLRQRGGALGLRETVEAAIAALGVELADRAEPRFELLARKSAPKAATAQLNAAIRVAGVLFEDGRADALARRLRSLQSGGGSG